MKLSEYIGETTSYDKKLMLERNDPTSWLKSVSAFANTQGGKLLFGVANDGVASADKVAKILKISPDGVRYHIKNLRAAGWLVRLGSRRKGSWLVLPVPSGNPINN